LRVLIVEDDLDSAELEAFILREEGHDVRVAHDCDEALEAGVQFVPEVVLMDIGLPGINGYDVARRLREHVALAHVPIIAITGYGQLSDLERTRAAGFGAHLLKPIEFEQLQRIVCDCVPA
jgi:CheY-like chemotaxis protein